MKLKIEDILSVWRSHIDERLASVGELYGDTHAVGRLSEASTYMVTGGGKRIRALLACCVWGDLAAIRGQGSENCRALSAAVALELVHAASLVHDDLPALDNDDLRRGKPSCHRAFGEATAILTGDALVGAAFLSVMNDAQLSSDEHARLSRILASAWVDLCVGQQLDIDRQLCGLNEAVSHDELVRMTRLKTGALFGAAVRCGALCAGVRDGDLDRFSAWGVRVGECFQAIDDLSDGDRPQSDRGDIERACQETTQALKELDSRLVSGMTECVLASVFAMKAVP